MKRLTLSMLALGVLPSILSGPTLRAAELDWVRVGTSGKTVIFLFKDDGGGEKAVVKTIDLSVHPQLTVNGAPAVVLDNPIYQKAGKDWLGPVGLPYVIYPLFGAVIKAGDQVQVSLPDNWVVCNGGPIAAVERVAVENFVGKSLLPPPPREYTMGIGFNLSTEEWGATYSMRANLMRGLSWYKATRSDKGPVPLGPNGLPTSIESEPVLNLRCPITMSGDFTLLWDGKDQLELINRELKMTTDVCTGGLDNKRVYAKAGDRPIGSVQLKFLGTDVRHIRVYPPGEKTDGSQYFDSQFLRMVRGAKCLRFMTEMWAFNSDITSFEDLRKDEQETKVGNRRIQAQVVKIEPYDNKDHFFMGEHRAYFLCTTAQPHGFRDGQHPMLDLKMPLVMSDGQTLKFPTGWALFGHVLSPTRFAVSFYVPGKDITLQATQEVSGTATVELKKPAMWLSEMADLVNAIDGCEMWLSVPFLMDDDGVRKMSAQLAGRLAKGRKVHLEYSNEVWNWAGYWGTDYCWAMSALDTDPNVRKAPWPFEKWYTKRAAQMWAIARDAFRKAGRDENDIVDLVAAQCMDGGAGHIGYAKDAHVRVDEFAVAPYWHVEPNEPYLKDTLAKVTDVDQLCDIADMSVQYRNSVDRFMQKTCSSLKQLGFEGRLVCYEGGPELGCFSATPDADSGKLSQGWSRHPRMAAWLRYYMQRMQDTYGVTLFEHFNLSQGDFPGNGPRRGTMLWPVYRRWNQLDGKGDGSDGLFNNLSDLQSKDCVSVMGYAYHDWLDRLNGTRP